MLGMKLFFLLKRLIIS